MSEVYRSVATFTQMSATKNGYFAHGLTARGKAVAPDEVRFELISDGSSATWTGGIAAPGVPIIAKLAADTTNVSVGVYGASGLSVSFRAIAIYNPTQVGRAANATGKLN